jgi:hypothetical protein
MNIKNTMCRLRDLTQAQINSLVNAMPDSDFFDFIGEESYIGVRPTGSWGAWEGNNNPTIVTYTEMMQLLKPKWTIYNNTLPWSELSDKQKGKMLLAQNNKLKFESFTSSGPTMPFSKGWVYVVEKPEPVKPEPTMEELFMVDTMGCTWNDLASTIIAKGWVKK